MTEDAPARPIIVFEEGLRDGAHESVVAMHGAYYAQAWRFDAFFERKVATELAEFMSRYDRSHDRMFLALKDGRIAGSLIVDGGEPDAATNGAHLRWFIIDDQYRGRGIGRMLIGAAMDFVRTAGFARCYLTTFAGLDRARALYERAGFKLVREAHSETWGTPVAVVSQQFVREFFPNENALGQTFRNGTRTLEIVGISGDTKHDRLRSPFPPNFYRAYLQERPENFGAMTFEVRTAASDASVIAAVREAVASIDRELPVFDIRTQNEQIAETVSQERLFVALTSTFAGLALVLACIGIYGILANSVARRTNEIGVRIALGAERRRVLTMILREALILAATGAVLGVAAALGLTRYIQSMLFGVQPIDPATIAGAVFLMIVVALLVSCPSRK